ncbi:MAG: lytic murein transglycosylase [Solirubrobacteraceae bacterium]
MGGALPASAQANVVTLTLLNGIKLSLPLPDGTPLSQLQIPPLSSPVVSISVGSPVAAPTAGGQLSLPGTSGTSAPTTLPAGPTIAPSIAGQAAQKVTGHKKSVPSTTSSPFGAAVTPPPATPQATQFRAADGFPLAGNPTLTLAPIGPVPIGVPNFFIDTFRIPPFLLPIYQAAGVEYDVPWQVLAAINDIETDYGRNLSVSSAGALGWMQFLPDTWKQYGVDANGDGVKDPYNPVDAIFGAARYLHAAGASQNLRQAIFAYNNAGWYVDSVLLRAKLVGGLPADLVSSITGLTDGLFPVHAAARYADDVAETAAVTAQAHSRNTAVPLTASARHTAVNIYAKPGSPVIAVKDGVIAGIGTSPTLGNFVNLRDASGNTYTYSQLKQVSALFAEPKPKTESAAQVARDLQRPNDPAPQAPASAGHQAAVAPTAATAVSQAAPAVAPPATDAGAGPQRLLVHSAHKAARAAGPVDLASYFTQSYGLRRSDVVVKPLVQGSHVIAGAILGRVGVTSSLASHVSFQVRPAGKGTPLIDPKPILDGWKLLEATSIYSAAAINPLSGQNPTIGQILLESKAQLQRQVLADPSVNIYSCGRRDIQAGVIDQRVLATLEFLSASGLKASVTALKCGTSLANTVFDKTGALSDNATGNGVDISAINGIPLTGHQGAGSITDITIRRLLTLQGTYKPHQIISLMSYPSTDNTFAASDHGDRIHIGFATLYDPNSKFGRAVNAALRPRQWLDLISRLGQIANPSVATQPSSSAITVAPGN